jgi:glycosidase
MKVIFKNIGFGSPKQNQAGKVEMNNFKPGDTVKFGLGVHQDGFDTSPNSTILAKLWTNIDHNLDPKTFYSIPMQQVIPTDDHKLAFSAEVPVTRLGTYKVTAMLSADNGVSWQYINDYGQKDIIVRPKVASFDSLNIREVNIGKANAKTFEHSFSTIEDMLDPSFGKYNLESLQAQGVNAVWIQCPFRADPWDKRLASDTAGSPYAVTDYFSIDRRLSKEAMKAPDWDLDKQHELANLAMKQLIDKAHTMGIKVFFCIAPNHVGHNYIFRDLVSDGHGGLSVKRNDFSNMTDSHEELSVINKKIADNQQPAYAEYLYPKMYASIKNGTYDPHGASNVHETMHDTWYGEWSDTKKLNHGAFAAHGIHQASTKENRLVLDYLGRVMMHAVTFLGVDGFRIDHTTGMPDQFFYETLPTMQAMVDKQAGKSRPVFIMSEDHDRKSWTAQVSDLVQSKWYEQIMDAMNQENVDHFFAVVSNPYFQELVQTGNHDEHRGIHAFSGDLMAYGRYICTMQLYGKAFSMLMGDEYAEGHKMHFLAYGGIPTLQQASEHNLSQPNQQLASITARSGKLKINHPALMSGLSERLHLKNHGRLPIAAFARHAYEHDASPVLVFSNLSNKHSNGGFYELDYRTQAFIREIMALAPNAQFQVRDLMSDNPLESLWSQPKTGAELIEQGLCALLRPYQVQALELIRQS